jgi:hypothetical protein
MRTFLGQKLKGQNHYGRALAGEAVSPGRALRQEHNLIAVQCPAHS